jgi:septum site-determining protein MinC
MDVNSADGSFADSSVAAFTRSRAAFDLKGVMSSLTVLRLRSRDLNLIERQLRAKVTQFPQFFQSAPVVLDVSELEGGVAGFPLAALVRALHVCRVVPVAVTNIDEANRPMAAAAGLGIVTLSVARPTGDPDAAAPLPVAPAPTTPAPSAVTMPQGSMGPMGPTGSMSPTTPMPAPVTPRPVPAAMAPAAAAPRTPAPAAMPVASAAPPRPAPSHRAPLVVRQPVRSGQLIYAERNDLIVLAPVNPGAQIIADGNIHVYAPMRGRAVAGAQGYADARIFCQRLEAELIAIAGTHLTFDDIPRDKVGRPAQISLQNGAIVVGAL